MTRHRPPRKRLLVLTQTFAPDPAAAGRYLTDVCQLMVARGHHVVVYSAKNGHDDPSVSYLSRELIAGIDVRRIAFASVGKRGLVRRAVASGWFMLRCAWAALTTRGLAGILVTTSPPFIGIVPFIVGRVRGVPFAYWAMDLNPEQLVALGKLSPGHFATRLLARVDRAVLRDATMVVALDRFMAKRLLAKGCHEDKLVVMPPWSHDPRPMTTARALNPFRISNGWGNKIVFLYSGNHTTSNPLSTVLEAAKRLAFRDDIHFAFVGGGAGKKDVDRLASDPTIRNITSLPYQPIRDLRVSLPAGDVHLVSLGDLMVGVIHPCKIYSAMATGRPLLYLGPCPSHITDIIDRYQIGWHVRHNDVEQTVAAIERIADLGAERLEEVGCAGHRAINNEFSKTTLCSRFCDELEARMLRPSGEWSRLAEPALFPKQGTPRVSNSSTPKIRAEKETASAELQERQQWTS